MPESAAADAYEFQAFCQGFEEKKRAGVITSNDLQTSTLHGGHTMYLFPSTPERLHKFGLQLPPGIDGCLIAAMISEQSKGAH